MTAPVLASAAPAPRKIRVLTVDDSVVVRHLLRQVLRTDPGLELAGAASNGVMALAQIPVVKPDVVILDIEMPEMDGLETLRQIRRRHPHLRIIMFSTLTVRGASATFEALSLGADDYLAKASGAGLEQSMAGLAVELIPKIRQFFVSSAAPRPSAPLPAPLPGLSRSRPRVVAIGVSTGGPQALSRLIPAIPAAFPLPILVVQHMPAMFTRLLADRLRDLSSLKVEEAADGAEIAPGRVLVAAGGYHLKVRRSGPFSFAAALDQGPPENSCRPSVDVLFRSLAEHYGAGVLSVILTGMGRDGLRGVEALKAAGSSTLAQDEPTSVVWGMPGAVAEAGLADSILPLDGIAAELVRRAAGGSRGGV